MAGTMLAWATRMASIIRHSSRSHVPVLPDLRNLGTFLRILLAVNGASAVIALAVAGSLDRFADTWVRITGYVEPHLIAELCILYALSPVLVRQPYRIGVALIYAITVGLGVAVHFGLRQMFPGAGDSLLKHLLLSLITTAVLIAYFRLRMRALSPAIAEARLQALQARIRPHFLFNSLNGVLSLVRRDPERAEEALHDMADLFRVLMRDNRELTPLAAEVTLCQQYLDRYAKVRKRTFLIFETEIPVSIFQPKESRPGIKNSEPTTPSKTEPELVSPPLSWLTIPICPPIKKFICSSLKIIFRSPTCTPKREA